MSLLDVAKIPTAATLKRYLLALVSRFGIDAIFLKPSKDTDRLRQNAMFLSRACPEMTIFAPLEGTEGPFHAFQNGTTVAKIRENRGSHFCDKETLDADL